MTALPGQVDAAQPGIVSPGAPEGQPGQTTAEAPGTGGVEPDPENEPAQRAPKGHSRRLTGGARVDGTRVQPRSHSPSPKPPEAEAPKEVKQNLKDPIDRPKGVYGDTQMTIDREPPPFQK